MSNQKQIAVSGTVEEWQVLVKIINAAVKSVGLECAKASVIWAERIEKAANDANTQPPKQAENPVPVAYDAPSAG